MLTPPDSDLPSDYTFRDWLVDGLTILVRSLNCLDRKK